MRDVPIFGAGVSSYSQVVTRQRRLNCFYSVRPDQDKNQVVLRGTPGAVIDYTLPQGPFRGSSLVAGILYAVAGAVLYSITVNNVITALGTIQTSVGTVGIKDNGLQILIVDGVFGYVYTLITGSYAQAALNAAGSFGVVTDPNFPNKGRTVAFLNGKMYVEQRPNLRRFSACESYDATNWTNSLSLSTFATKDNYSDNILGVWSVNGALFPIGEGSAEVWQDIGSAPLAVARIQGATQRWGCVAFNSVIEMNSTLFMLGTSEKGGMKFLKLIGTTWTPISTSDIDNLITSFAFWQDAIALGYVLDGHQMIVLTFPTANRSFLYDDTTGFWGEVQSGLGLTGRYFGNLSFGFNTFSYVTDTQTGSFYRLSSAVFTDNGAQIKRQVTSRHLHADGNMLFINELVVDMETGIGLVSGQGSDPVIGLRISKDGGRTFGVMKPKKLGKLGKFKKRAWWRRLGGATDFVLELTMTDPVKFTVVHGSVTTSQKEGANGV